MRTERDTTICPSEMTATSLVPPPTSTTMRPTGSAMGTPAPIAAAIDSSMRCTCRAPADRALEEVPLPPPRRSRRLLDRAALDLGDPRRRAHDEARVRAAAIEHLGDEVAQHLLGDLEVRDDAVAQRARGRDRRGRPTDHPLG